MSKHVVNQPIKGESMIRKAVVGLAAAAVFSFVVNTAQASRDEYYERGEGYEHGERYEHREGRYEESKFYGNIESLPQSGLNGTWRVSGRNVIVTDRTYIKQEYGPVAVGAYVEVKGGGNPFTAYEIETKGGRR
jgi:hypothetical protein